MRTYSKGACATCRRRRKKCGEERPKCAACIRLSLDCSYDRDQQEKQALLHLGTFKLEQKTACPVNSSLPTNLCRFRGEAEEAVLGQMSQTADAFYGPTCQGVYRDLSLLCQMTIEDDLVRNSIVASFSKLSGPNPSNGELNRDVYGQALQMLRARISQQQPDASSRLRLQSAITFIGALTSMGAEESEDILAHWKAIANIFSTVRPKDPFKLPIYHRNVYVLVLETTVYHLSCHALFSDNVSYVRTLSHQAQLFGLLHEINPPGPERHKRSAILSGQYEIYAIVLELTCIHRDPARRNSISTDLLDQIEMVIDNLHAALPLSLGKNVDHSCSTPHQLALTEIYRMFLRALTICVVALRKPYQERGQDIDMLASTILAQFIGLDNLPMNYAPATWPLLVLACAIRHEDQFQEFVNRVNLFVNYLDAGHTIRLKRMIRMVTELRQGKTAPTDWSQSDRKSLPVGLSLLRKSGGVLS